MSESETRCLLIEMVSLYRGMGQEMKDRWSGVAFEHRIRSTIHLSAMMDRRGSSNHVFDKHLATNVFVLTRHAVAVLYCETVLRITRV